MTYEELDISQANIPKMGEMASKIPMFKNIKICDINGKELDKSKLKVYPLADENTGVYSYYHLWYSEFIVFERS